RRRHTRWPRDWSSDVCSSDLHAEAPNRRVARGQLLQQRLLLEQHDRLRLRHLREGRQGKPCECEYAHLRKWGAIVLLECPGVFQIGRASCRERSEVSVVAGVL